MALDLKTFQTRTLSAIVFVVVMLSGMLLSEWGFISLFTIIMIGCLYEFGQLAKKINSKKYLYFIPIAFIYIILPINMMIQLATNGFFKPAVFSPVFPAAILFSIWLNDTMAYLVGSFIGKTPFSKISPKKTWEGTIGGAVLCVLIIGCVFPFLPFHHQSVANFHWAIIAALCAVFGTVGDLLESKIKRMANVKDSGQMMPGHGGFLDRFDSMLLAIPAVWIYIKLFLL